MLPERDRQTLFEAGIEDPESVEIAAAQFVREHPIYAPVVMKGALMEHEEDYLLNGGAMGIGEPDQKSVTRNITLIASEYATMVASAYSQKEAAKCLGVSTSRIRQKISDGSLYAISGAGGRVCPRWEFYEKGALPGLEYVLAAISKEAHPVAVQRFFLNLSPDLESPVLGSVISPRDWLITGHSPDDVIVLAQAL